MRYLALAAVLFTGVSRASADTTLNFTGTVTADGPTYVLVPFDVPAGTAEIQVHHELVADGGTDILDFGLWDTNGFRGWGGGNHEDIVVGEQAASRSYHPGPMPVGTWNVVIGKALVASAANYAISVTLRDAPTLPAATDRATYAPVPALATGARYYAGDFHVHSRESGDARPTLDSIATFARAQGLDFVELSDHNTDSQVDLIVPAQAGHPDLLFIPGDEFTTYQGHANGIGATRYVDHRLGLNGRTATEAADELHAQGALFSINHPLLDLGDLCIGCAWHNDDVTAAQVDGLEIENGAYSVVGQWFLTDTLKMWERFLGQGQHVAALGGSDDHNAGVNEGAFGSTISQPTTLVYATELSVAGILDGVRHARTVVKLEGPGDPMIDLTAGDLRVGDTIQAASAHLKAVVTGANGAQVHWVHNSVAQTPVQVTSDPFTFETDIQTPPNGEDRWRAQVLIDGAPRTLTSHIWITPPTGSPDAGLPVDQQPDSGKSGCGCGSSSAGTLGFAMLAALGMLSRRRART